MTASHCRSLSRAFAHPRFTPDALAWRVALASGVLAVSWPAALQAAEVPATLAVVEVNAPASVSAFSMTPAEARAALERTAGGVAVVATLGPRTLWELRAAFALIDGARHTIDFHSAPDWIRAAQAAALTPLAHDTLELHACAPDLRGLLQDIKRIGAATVDGGRRRQPLGRAAWARLQASYERHRRADGHLPATYDVILLALRKPLQPARS